MKARPMYVSPNRVMPTEGRNNTTVTLERLEQRLDEGYRMIDQRLAVGMDVTDLEDFWIRLLREYESRCDSLPIAA